MHCKAYLGLGLERATQVLVDGRAVGRLERSNPRSLTLPATLPRV